MDPKGRGTTRKEDYVPTIFGGIQTREGQPDRTRIASGGYNLDYDGDTTTISFIIILSICIVHISKLQQS